MKKKDIKNLIFVDCEANGKSPSTGKLTEFGAVAYPSKATFHGVLAGEPSGSGGFGYDPVVYLPEIGKTVAELSDPEKDSLSHRGKAAERLLGLLGLQPF